MIKIFKFPRMKMKIIIRNLIKKIIVHHLLQCHLSYLKFQKYLKKKRKAKNLVKNPLKLKSKKHKT